MLKVRNQAFETNSSSLHSISIGDGESHYINDLKVDSNDNKVHSQYGEFGWGYEDYDDAAHKLSYALTMAAENESMTFYNEETNEFQTEGFHQIEELIKDKCNCDGIEVEKNYNTWYPDGYVDHQSRYPSLKDFLDDWRLSLEQFIFDTNVTLIIDNDNH